jgi:hypothetical protein
MACGSARMAADGKLIHRAHTPDRVRPAARWTLWANACVTEQELSPTSHLSDLNLWVAGHRHVNTVPAFQIARPGPSLTRLLSGQRLAQGFPAAFRKFEINRNSDDTVRSWRRCRSRGRGRDACGHIAHLRRRCATAVPE